MMSFKKSKFDEWEVPMACRPHKTSRSEVQLTALFCAFCQLLTSSLLFKEFVGKDEKIASAATPAIVKDVPPELADKTLIIVKFICAMLFHFKFESQI
jgi:hypothetical protein